MARNRKSQSAAIRVGAAVKALLLCALIGGSAVGYVWHQEQNYKLGRQKEQLEKRLDALRRHNKSARDNLAVLCLPNQIAARVLRMNPGLEPAQPGQYLRLQEPLAEASPNPAVLAGDSIASTP